MSINKLKSMEACGRINHSQAIREQKFFLPKIKLITALVLEAFKDPKIKKSVEEITTKEKLLEELKSQKIYNDDRRTDETGEEHHVSKVSMVFKYFSIYCKHNREEVDIGLANLGAPTILAPQMVNQTYTCNRRENCRAPMPFNSQSICDSKVIQNQWKSFDDEIHDRMFNTGGLVIFRSKFKVFGNWPNCFKYRCDSVSCESNVCADKTDVQISEDPVIFAQRENGWCGRVDEWSRFESLFAILPHSECTEVRKLWKDYFFALKFPFIRFTSIDLKNDKCVASEKEFIRDAKAKKKCPQSFDKLGKFLVIHVAFPNTRFEYSEQGRLIARTACQEVQEAIINFCKILNKGKKAFTSNDLDLTVVESGGRKLGNEKKKQERTLKIKRVSVPTQETIQEFENIFENYLN